MGAAGARCSKPGPVPRGAGANGALAGPGLVLCRNLPGRRRAPEHVAARISEFSCQMVGRWIQPGWDRDATCSCQLILQGSCVGPHCLCSRNCSSS